jgi:hypothetical protein
MGRFFWAGIVSLFGVCIVYVKSDIVTRNMLEPDRSRMRRVITIHGINSDGKWQELIGKILSPHFEHVPIKYDQYRHLGPLKLVLEPWVLAVGGPVCLVLTATSILNRPWAIWGLVLLLAFVGAYIRRKKTLREVKATMDPYMVLGSPAPHLIAHSFGTYLSCRALALFGEIEFDRIILTGSVLRRGFWNRLAPGRSASYGTVRNEKCTRDRVAQLAFLMYGFVPGMGHSGFAGFRPQVKLVHDLADSWSVCSLCNEAESIAPVHNVPHPELGHSDLLIGRGHALRFWLPILWKIEPREYDEFIKLCRLAVALQEEKDYKRLEKVERLLWRRKWHWANGTLPQYVRLLMCARSRKTGIDRHSRTHVESAVSLVWNAVNEGAEAALEAADPTASVIKALYPNTAVVRAIEAVCS